MSNLKQLMWVALGAILGAAAGIGVAFALMLYEQWRYPSDASAGSVGIIAVLTFPLGIFLGIVGSCYYCTRMTKRRQPRGFDIKSDSGPGAAG